MRAFAVYAAVSLVAVVVLGVVLAASYRVEARRRGVAEGRSEAQLLASTAVEPLLDGRPLSAGLTPAEVIGLKNLTTEVVGPTDGVLRLRLRDLKGQVVYSDDGSGYHDVPEDEALDAAGRANPVLAQPGSMPTCHPTPDRSARPPSRCTCR